MSAGETGAMIGAILGLIFNIFIQVLILKWITVKFIYNGEKGKINNMHYVIFIIIGAISYVLIRNALGTW